MRERFRISHSAKIITFDHLNTGSCRAGEMAKVCSRVPIARPAMALSNPNVK